MPIIHLNTEVSTTTMVITSAISGLLAVMLGSFAGLRLIVSIGIGVAVGTFIFNMNLLPIGLIVIAGITLIPMVKSFYGKTGIYAVRDEIKPPELDEETIQIIRSEAGQGDAQNQFKLGVMYNIGQGVAQDYNEAVNWFRLAADQGLAEAQHFLGLMYLNGQGVPESQGKGVEWLRLSANQNNVESMSIPNVKPAYADAATFKKYAMTTLGIREGNIIDMRDATGAQMNRVFGTEALQQGQLSDWVRKDTSNVYVYYAGHGAPGGSDGNSYLIPFDADSSRIEINGYPLKTLYGNLSRLNARSVTVVLEACFSGASQGGSIISNASPVYLKAKTPTIPKNITVIAAGASDQMASWEKDGSNGLFTKYYLKGMSGEADKKPSGNADGTVTHGELKAYLQETLTYFARRYYGRDQTAQIVVGSGR